MLNNIKQKNCILALILLMSYFIYNLITLSAYPYIHSDESWLSGLSRTVLDKGSFSVSEPFFDLYPRAIHGLRVVFVSIQMSFIKLFTYSIFSLRLISLIFATLTLILIYIYYRSNKNDKYNLLLFLTILGFNIQFIHTAHIARQEAIIMFAMIASYILTIKLKSKYRSIIIASIIGLSIGVHPNSFIIGLSIGLLLLYKTIKGDFNFKELILYVLTLSIFASLFIAISLNLNSNFINDYLAFGKQLGVTANDIGRFQGLYYYYYKIFYQIGGTYYLANIKFSLAILLLSFIISFILIISKKYYKSSFSNNAYIYSFIMLIGINIGYFIIGRYNQTAIIFVLLFGFICFYDLISNIKYKYIIRVILIVILIIELSNTYHITSQTNYQDYKVLGIELSKIIPRDAHVLANLNLDYHFDLYQLYDYRNLNHLHEYSMDFEDYIEANDIAYIIIYDEMDYIYENRPKWNILYGDLDYYNDMIDYSEKKCTLIKEIKMPTYAMRIAKYVDVFPWNARIYKVN